MTRPWNEEGAGSPLPPGLDSWFLGWGVKVKSLSRVRLFATLWTVAYQAPPAVGFSRQEYWSWGGGWSVLKRNVDFWIPCLDHPVNLSPARVHPGAALGCEGLCLPSGRIRLDRLPKAFLQGEVCSKSLEMAFPTSRLW